MLKTKAQKRMQNKAGIQMQEVVKLQAKSEHTKHTAHTNLLAGEKHY